MKIERVKEEYRPVTITLETEAEYIHLRNIVNRIYYCKNRTIEQITNAQDREFARAMDDKLENFR